MKKNKEELDILGGNPFETVLGEARYIILYDVITSESAREINTKLLAMGMQNQKKPIYLEINSPGGSVSDGVAIMNTIQQVPCPVITIINGEACSMGGIISVVADRRLITPNSFWLGHPMYDCVEGNPQTIKDRGIYLEKLENNLQQVFKEKTKLTDKEFQQMLKGELWLSSEECLEKGIVDEILENPVRTLKISKIKKGKKQ